MSGLAPPARRERHDRRLGDAGFKKLLPAQASAKISFRLVGKIPDASAKYFA
jgi:hypothetical protein